MQRNLFARNPQAIKTAADPAPDPQAKASSGCNEYFQINP
jgi:hypothetical protein